MVCMVELHVGVLYVALMLATRHATTGYTAPARGQSFCATARTGWVQSFVPAKFSNVLHGSHRPSI
jgi:hypothetical protein